MNPEHDLSAPDRRADAVSIAVVIVCRNARGALESTLASVRGLRDWRVRLIVIDGASTDGTPAVLAALRREAHFVSSEPDAGIYDAMNKGWRAAPAHAHVLYLGAGDTIVSLPGDASLRDEGGAPAPVVLGDCLIGNLLFRSRWSAQMRWRNTSHHQAMMVYKAVSPDPPFDPALRVYGDWDFNLRLMRRGVRARRVEGFLTRALPGGASWRHDFREIRAVAARHGGAAFGALAWTLNRLSVALDRGRFSRRAAG